MEFHIVFLISTVTHFLGFMMYFGAKKNTFKT